MITARLRREARRAVGGDAVAKLRRLAQEAAAGRLRVVPVRSPDAADEKAHRHRPTMRGGRRTTARPGLRILAHQPHANQAETNSAHPAPRSAPPKTSLG